jgi:hypothetical protein
VDISYCKRGHAQFECKPSWTRGPARTLF